MRAWRRNASPASVSAIVRAESYQHQGNGVVEGELASPVDGATCPGGMAMIDQRFCVDRYEGTLVEVLPAGACIVQRGTSHAWRNETTEPALVAFVVVGARRFA